MKMRLFTVVFCLLVIGALPAQAQFQQDPLDDGVADTVDMVLTVAPDATTNQLNVQFDLWVFNDSNELAGATMGFNWDNSNMQMDSAVATTLVTDAFNLFLTLYENNNLAVTNTNQRFNLAGTRSPGNPGILPDPNRRQWASYYFTLSDWNVSDSIVLDTNEYSPSIKLQFTRPDAQPYVPYWTGAIIVRDTAVPSNLLLSEDTLFYSAEEGGAFPPSQTFDVLSDNAPLNFTLDEDAGWIVKSPSSGTTPENVTVSINTTALPAGVYFDSIEVAAPQAANSPQYLYVQLDLQQPPPVIAVDPSSFIFNAVAGGSNPPTQDLDISNIGGSTLNWTVSNSESWLSLSPMSGSGDGTVTLSVDITGLAFNDYFDTVVVSDPTAENDPVRVPVRLTVGSDLPIIAADSAFNYVVVDLPDAIVPPRDFEIFNDGAGQMTLSLSTNSPRITLSDTSGTAPKVFTATFDLVGEGSNGDDIYDTVWVSSDEAINSPFPVVFRFHFVDIPARVNASPATIEFDIYECYEGFSGAPFARNVSVINGGGDNPMQAYLVYESDLFTVNRDTIQTPGTFTVTPNILDWPVGTYEDTILVGANNAINSPDTVIVVYNLLEGTEPPEILLSRQVVIDPLKEDAGPVALTGFEVSNAQDGCMEWYLEEDAPWAFVQDTSGINGDVVRLIFDPTGFPLGEYEDTIFVYSDEAVNSPQTVRLIMRVWSFNGDVNWDGNVDLADAIYLVAYLFNSGPFPQPEFIVGDVNCDNDVDLEDVIYLVNYLFLAGPEPCGNPFKSAES
ncbi:hypothetical protein GF420_01170 [candidate division GN15 bacterium]|nr:hypothetical protein [candidate division GN15 bacterium]